MGRAEGGPRRIFLEQMTNSLKLLSEAELLNMTAELNKPCWNRHAVLPWFGSPHRGPKEPRACEFSQTAGEPRVLCVDEGLYLSSSDTQVCQGVSTLLRLFK